MNVDIGKGPEQSDKLPRGEALQLLVWLRLSLERLQHWRGALRVADGGGGEGHVCDLHRLALLDQAARDEVFRHRAEQRRRRAKLGEAPEQVGAVLRVEAADTLVRDLLKPLDEDHRLDLEHRKRPHDDGEVVGLKVVPLARAEVCSDACEQRPQQRGREVAERGARPEDVGRHARREVDRLLDDEFEQLLEACVAQQGLALGTAALLNHGQAVQRRHGVDAVHRARVLPRQLEHALLVRRRGQRLVQNPGFRGAHGVDKLADRTADRIWSHSSGACNVSSPARRTCSHTPC
mmetsp:Transcript_9877/g.21602  ORF Transcript_9877/g.21602 Transcript_9877/m.21602 type:complete len:292 (-) Transcript_9877:227-1102(-)